MIQRQVCCALACVAALLAPVLATSQTVVIERSGEPEFRMVRLGTLGGAGTRPEIVSDGGIVVGWSFDEKKRKLLFVWHNGRMLPAALGLQQAEAILAEHGTQAEAEDETPEALGPSEGPRPERVRVVNDRAAAVVQRADRRTALKGFRGDDPPFKQGRALGTSDRGAIVGWGVQKKQGFESRRALLWTTVDRDPVDLGDLGGGASLARKVNRQTTVVGWSLDAEKQRRAFVWTEGRMRDLNTMASDIPEDLQLIDGTAVSNRGHVVGMAETPKGAFGFVLLPKNVEAKGRVPFDTDGNGLIDADELTALAQATRPEAK